MKKFLYLAVLALGVVLLMAPPVMAQEEKPFTIHGEVRFRGEYQNNAQDLDDNTDDGALFWPYRVRIAAEGRFTKNVTGWIEFQNGGVAGDTLPYRTGAGADSVELYQGNITLDQFIGKNFSLRIGRQEITAGTELLLGDLDFYQGLSHDGLVGTWRLKKGSITGWYTRPFENSVASGGFLPPDQVTIGSADNTTHFMGAYATWTILKNQSIDVYLMDTIVRRSAAGASSDGIDIYTIGGRYARDMSGKTGLFWNVEYAIQSGSFAQGPGPDADLSGNVGEGWLGWNIHNKQNNHRFYAKLAMASGDDSTTADNEGFQPLFGDFHNRLGRGDWFQLADNTTGLVGGVSGGITALSIGYTGNYGDKQEFGAALWQYSLDQVPSGADDNLGSAIDVWYGYNYSRNVAFQASLSQLSPGDALTGGGGAPDDAVTRLYGQARLRF